MWNSPYLNGGSFSKRVIIFFQLGAFFNIVKRQMRAGIHPARKMKAAMLIARCELDQDCAFD